MSTRDLRPSVDIVELAWIPVAPGRRLAARLFLPKSVESDPAPVILEYIPYRRRDGTRLGDDEMHIWFAAHGYAAVRVDIAGMGDSDGLVEDEYAKREQDDALEVIEWLGRQNWCNGNVGMIGISWGGFNALQIAARRPPRLKAVVTICSTDDRYACDAHYLGGCLLNDNFSWGGAFFNYAALPPDPAMVGKDRWREMWKTRIDNHVMFPAEWLKHQTRDAFWKQGSICENFAAIECPVFAVGGWLDGYTQTIFRLVENLKAPCKGLVGPWGHKEPQRGVPGPAIGFLQECARWWDQYLKGKDRGIERDPPMRLWLQDYAEPRPHFLTRPGRWLGFAQWPNAKIKPKLFYPQANDLTTKRSRAKQAFLTIRSPQTTGLRAQEWCPYGQGRVAAESATDQREDDSGSLCFDTAPLGKPVKIAGEGAVSLRIAADKPRAFVVVRLCDVSPDGTSALVTFGVLNLCHHTSHELPQHLKPGKFIDAKVTLKPIAQMVPRGHRLRLAISSSYWPMVWPSPDNVTLTIDPSASYLRLPLLQSSAGLTPCRFKPAEYAMPGPVTVKEPARETRNIHFNVECEETTFYIESDDGRYIIDEIGTEVASTRAKTYKVSRHDPLSTRTSVACHQEFKRDGWDAVVSTEIDIRCDKTRFYVQGWVRALDNGQLFAERHFEETIKRKYL